MNVKLGSGKVHGADEYDGFMPSPKCGGNRAAERYFETSDEVNCKRCMLILEREKANEVEGEGIVTESVEMNTEETPHAEVLEQIEANIERAASLAEVENVEALEELSAETEELISNLPSRGKGANGKTWTQTKKDFRAAFKAASQAQPKKEVAKVSSQGVVVPKDYTEYPDVVELVHMGAERMAEGVKLHLRTSDIAKEIAQIGLDMWRRLPTKDGHPDLMGNSDAAKRAIRDLYEEAGKGFEHTWDNEEALKKLQRAVQFQRGDVRAQYLRDLDSSTPEAEEERQRFAAMLKDKPSKMPVSEFVADFYGTSLKGPSELQRERYAAKRKALQSGNEPEAPESETTPDDRIRAAARKMKTDVRKVKPEDFESASEETKEAVRAELEEIYNAVKAMIAATL